MAADETIVTKRVTETLNECAAGTFSATIDSGYLDRNATAIAEAVREGALMIARTVVQKPDHPHRNLFVSATPTTLTHAAELPDYATDADVVEIERYSGAPFQVGIKLDAYTIDQYRENPSSIYDAVAHNANGSILGGFYDIYKNHIYFTGNAARMYPPAVSRATAASLMPDEYEDTWVKLSIGLTVKEGDNMFPIAQYYYNLGLSDLEDIKGAAVRFPPLPDPREMKWQEAIQR